MLINYIHSWRFQSNSLSKWFEKYSTCPNITDHGHTISLILINTVDSDMSMHVDVSNNSKLWGQHVN